MAVRVKRFFILSRCYNSPFLQTECEICHFCSPHLEVPTRCETRSLGGNKLLSVKGTSGDDEVVAGSKKEG